MVSGFLPEGRSGASSTPTATRDSSTPTRNKRTPVSLTHGQLPEAPGQFNAETYPFNCYRLLEPDEGAFAAFNKAPQLHSADEETMLRPSSVLHDPSNMIVLYDRGQIDPDNFEEDALSHDGPLPASKNNAVDLSRSAFFKPDQSSRVLTTLAEIMPPRMREEIEFPPSFKIPGSTAQTRRHHVAMRTAEVIGMGQQGVFLYQAYIAQRGALRQMWKAKSWISHTLQDLIATIRRGDEWSAGRSKSQRPLDGEASTSSSFIEDPVKMFLHFSDDEDDETENMEGVIPSSSPSIAPQITSSQTHRRQSTAETISDDASSTSVTLFTPSSKTRNQLQLEKSPTQMNQKRIDFLNQKYRLRIAICKVLDDINKELGNAVIGRPHDLMYRKYGAPHQYSSAQLSSRQFLEALRVEKKRSEELAWELMRREKRIKDDKARMQTMMGIMAGKRLQWGGTS